MPNYEFQCKKCNKKFSMALSVKEREEGKYKCPKCGSRKPTCFWHFLHQNFEKGLSLPLDVKGTARLLNGPGF